MNLPPPPAAGELLAFRRVGRVVGPPDPGGRRQVAWEDGTACRVGYGPVVDYPAGQWFECVAVYVYVGDGFQTGPVTVTAARPIAAPDPAAARALYDKIMAREHRETPP